MGKTESERKRCANIVQSEIPDAHGHPLMGSDEHVANVLERILRKITNINETSKGHSA